jgi:3-dehydroquinate dehydratase/shikimate dehydrogenase
LPIEVGDLRQLRKMLDALKVRAVIVSSGLGSNMLPLADDVDDVDRQSGYVDLLLKKSDDKWHGYNSLWRCGLKALESRYSADGGEFPLERCNMLVLGTGGAAPALLYAGTQRRALVSVCGPNDKEAQRLAAAMNCRFVPFQNAYSTLADAVVIADPALKSGVQQGSINPSLLKAGMTVVDVSDPPVEHPLLGEARTRGCKLVESASVFVEQVAAQFRSIAGKDLPAGAVSQALGE